jgi:hypothetical protein
MVRGRFLHDKEIRVGELPAMHVCRMTWCYTLGDLALRTRGTKLRRWMAVRR